ncbi:hypothetical protein Desor_2800 [Desulfosporosinus orientis DSM 765]|uniref:Uncharacterized protein n=1 Tax=Desulfosporosinus orientis (strain ATCC 19365 / DSM 765 / NCIMB 8382 / VKM B-1628 / Singapore I) TaxID=768706 RepID=G7WDL3_DESOD|nr:hypothetical protein Desor_2800 [Desulfosporosinus orientis DSM 765]
MQEYPEVRTRSRTVQRGSGGTRRRVLYEDTVFARINITRKALLSRARQKNRPAVYPRGFFQSSINKGSHKEILSATALYANRSE